MRNYRKDSRPKTREWCLRQASKSISASCDLELWPPDPKLDHLMGHYIAIGTADSVAAFSRPLWRYYGFTRTAGAACNGAGASCAWTNIIRLDQNAAIAFLPQWRYSCLLRLSDSLRGICFWWRMFVCKITGTATELSSCWFWIHITLGNKWGENTSVLFLCNVYRLQARYLLYSLLMNT